MRMRKAIAIMAVLCIVLTFASCNKSDGTDVTTADGTSAAASESGSGAGNTAVSASDGAVDVDIVEKYYVSYINDIYSANYTKYLGKIIRIEGMFKTESYEDGTYRYVYRVGPGCCGNDGSMCGFEFTYDGEMPAESDWIRVVGKLDSYVLNGNTFLTIDASSVEILPDSERGAENVK